MAYRLYGDTTREPGMVSRADPIHPGFMPPSFEALSA
jgi:prophage DNA circulation protein